MSKHHDRLRGARDPFFESTQALYCTCEHRVESHDVTITSSTNTFTPSPCFYPLENGEQCPCETFDPKPYKQLSK